jgi:hypothetical protein
VVERYNTADVNLNRLLSCFLCAVAGRGTICFPHSSSNSVSSKAVRAIKVVTISWNVFQLILLHAIKLHTTGVSDASLRSIRSFENESDTSNPNRYAIHILKESTPSCFISYRQRHFLRSVVSPRRRRNQM